MRNIRLKRLSRHKRVRKNVSGTGAVPRLVVFRSNKYIYGQVIDDSAHQTIVAFSDLNLEEKNKKNSGPRQTKVEKARQVGLNIAKLATTKKIKKVVFDRGGYKYHGRVKALAQGAREGGLVF